MQSMGSIKVLPPSSSNTPLVQIIILKPNAQHTLINTLNIQINPFINLTNIVVNDIMDITLKPHVHPFTHVHPNLRIKVFIILKLQDLWNQQNSQVLMMHQLANTYIVYHPQHLKLMWGQY